MLYCLENNKEKYVYILYRYVYVYVPSRHFKSVVVEPVVAEVQLYIIGILLLFKPSLTKSRSLDDSDKKLEITCSSFSPNFHCPNSLNLVTVLG